jgi:hypothetical protein
MSSAFTVSAAEAGTGTRSLSAMRAARSFSSSIRSSPSASRRSFCRSSEASDPRNGAGIAMRGIRNEASSEPVAAAAAFEVSCAVGISSALLSASTSFDDNPAPRPGTACGHAGRSTVESAFSSASSVPRGSLPPLRSCGASGTGPRDAVANCGPCAAASSAPTFSAVSNEWGAKAAEAGSPASGIGL